MNNFLNQQEISQIIKETFDKKPFNAQQFLLFCQDLLPQADFSKEKIPKKIPDSFKDYVQSFKRLGRFTDDQGNIIDILTVKLRDKHCLENARSAQRNFIAGYLGGKYGSSSEKNAALVAFYYQNDEKPQNQSLNQINQSNNNGDWRFSLVERSYVYNKENNQIENKISQAKRHSFLLGENEGSNTICQNFQNFFKNGVQSLKALREVFSVEKVTQEFFEEYKKLYLNLLEEIEKHLKQDPKTQDEFKNKNISNENFAENFAKKLLGQIVFLYFLQKKGWLGVAKSAKWGDGDKNFLQNLFNKKYKNYDNFFNDILEPLFYEALAKENDQNFYHNFNCLIPYLNGGLFEPLAQYNWKQTDILLDNQIFVEIFAVFNLYNFTVFEEQPLEKEVAVDPEMLGRVFENLLEIKDRKSKGAFYTPREIVHYMCKESLIQFISGRFAQIPLTEIEILVNQAENLLENEKIVTIKTQNAEYSGKYQNKIGKNIIQNSKQIDFALQNIKICDPAVGSGAFPVAMINEIVAIRLILNSFENAQNQDNQGKQTNQNQQQNTYLFKREVILNSIYATDIEASAIEIAKLRLWLSLIVEENNFQNITPLPNLDFKIMQGNSLVEDFEGIKLFNNQDLGSLFNCEKIKQLKQLSEDFFKTSHPEQKITIKNQIEQNQWQLINQTLKEENKTEAEIAKIKNAFKSNEKPFFLWQLNFPEVFEEQETRKAGFDIIIGNPPYIQLQKFKNSPLQAIYKNQNFQTYDGSGDIYCLFYEKGISLLKTSGILCFITSNKWMRAGYGEKLRGFFASHNPLQLIDLGGNVFENATVDTNILLIAKEQSQNQLKALTINQSNNKLKTKPQTMAEIFKENAIHLPNLGKNGWFIGNLAAQNLKTKIENLGTALKDWDVKIYRGVLTGLNEAFIINTKTKELLCDQDPKSIEILKPILRGRDIKKYGYNWAELWVIATFPALKIDIDEYLAVKKYLLDFGKDRLEQAGKKLVNGTSSRKKTGNKWFETQDQIAYHKEFEKEKVVYSEIVREPQFYFDSEGNFFCEATSFLITGKNLKFLCGTFNSKAFTYFFRICYAGGGLGETGFRYKKKFFELVPIPKITQQNQAIIDSIENLVEQILTLKKAENEQFKNLNQPSKALKNAVVNPKTQELEAQIDQLVYQLYNLSEAEIALIEAN